MIRRIIRTAAIATLASAASWGWAGPKAAAPQAGADPLAAAAQAQNRIQEMQGALSVVYAAAAKSDPDAMRKSAQALEALQKQVMDVLDPTGLKRAVLSLSRTLDHQYYDLPSRSAEELGTVDKAMSSVQAQLEALAGPGSQAEIARRRQEVSSSQAVKVLREAVRLYTRDHEGWPPMDPGKRLVPDYLAAIPPLELPGHKPQSGIRVLRRVADEAGLKEQLTDGGGWAYVADMDSPWFGEFFIDCTHEDAQGRPWFKR